MNYAQNLHQAELITAVRDWISSEAPGINTEKWLLFDGAVLGEKTTKKLISMLPTNAVHNIFAGTQLSPYQLLSPHLVHLSFEQALVNRVRTLLEHTTGLPAVSLLSASGDAQTVGRHLLWLGQARTGDGMDLYCRFADTRITPSLITTLYEGQLAIFTSCIHEWWVVDRYGGLDTVLRRSAKVPPMDTGERNVYPVEQFLLSDSQFSTMMEAAEPDEIFQMLCEGAPDLIPEQDLGDFYFRLQKLAAAAHKNGLKQTKDIYLFSVIALVTSDEFYLAPELSECWKKMQAGMDDFSKLVGQWHDDTWDAIGIFCTTNPTEFPQASRQHNSI